MCAYVVASIVAVSSSFSFSNRLIDSPDSLQKSDGNEFRRFEIGLQLGIPFGLTIGVHANNQITARGIFFVLPRVTSYGAMIQYAIFSSASFDVYPLLVGGGLRLVEDKRNSITGQQVTETIDFSIVGLGLGGEYFTNDSRSFGIFVDLLYDHISGGSSGSLLGRNLSGSFATLDAGIRYHF